MPIARYKALSCIRMAVQQAVVKQYYLGKLPDSNKWNVDASAMIQVNGGTGAKMYRVVSCHLGDILETEDHFAKLLKHPLTSVRFQDSLNCFTKWMQLQSCNGDFGQLCLLAAMNGMPEGSFYTFQFQDLRMVQIVRFTDPYTWPRQDA